MARYFGGFRDRLKKRSKHVPVTIKDVEWVKVATTFSWSPARRDYQWLEPEDYLSSFLSSSDVVYESPDDLSDEIHGDGSMDAAMDMPFSSAAYDGSDTLIGISSADDEIPITHVINEFEEEGEEDEGKIGYVPPYDFVQETTSAFAEEGILRPNIDVPAELPLLDEYKLEIVSALQRRGIKIDADKIKLPEDLIVQLNAYHAGRVSIDSYELRARLQKYKKQVIESYEQFNAVSGTVNPDISMPEAGPVNAEIETDLLDTGDDGKYEEFILSSLNRLEASMNEQDSVVDAAPDMNTPEAKGIDGTDVFDEANQTMDFRGSIRTTRHIETPPDTSDILAEGISGLDGKVAPPEGDLPSSYADDSWLVLPVDSRKAGKDLENPDNYEDPGEQTLTVLRGDQVVGAIPPVQPPVDPDPGSFTTDPQEDDAAHADSSELLKALNTINSRFPETTIDADALELNTADLTLAADDALITPTPPSAPVVLHEEIADVSPELQPEAEPPPEIPQSEIRHEPLETMQGPVVPQDAAAPEGPPAVSIEDETSLSDLLLQLRHEGDQTQREEQAVTPEQPATGTPPASPTPSMAGTPPAVESVEERRARYIEEERKKLYSIIDGLEENAPSIAQSANPIQQPTDGEQPETESETAPAKRAQTPPGIRQPTAPQPAPEAPVKPVDTDTLAEKSKLIENILAAKESMAGGKRVEPVAPQQAIPPVQQPERQVPKQPAPTRPEQVVQSSAPKKTQPVAIPPAVETPPAARQTAHPVPPAPVPQMPDTQRPTIEVAANQAPANPQATPKPQDVTQPVTPAPVTPAPVTPAPVTPAPVTPAPVTPAPAPEAPLTETPVPEVPATNPTKDTPVTRPFGALGLEKLAASPEMFDTSNIEDVFNKHEESLQNADGAISGVADPVFSPTDDEADTAVSPQIVSDATMPVRGQEEAAVPAVPENARQIPAPPEDATVAHLASEPSVSEPPASKQPDIAEIAVEGRAGEDNAAPHTVAADAIDDATRGIIADFASVDTEIDAAEKQGVREPAMPSENLDVSEIKTASAATLAPREVRAAEEAQQAPLSAAGAPQDVEPIRPESKDRTYMSEPQVTEPTVPELADSASEATPPATPPDQPAEEARAAEAAPPVDPSAVQEITVAIGTAEEASEGKVVPESVKDEGLVEVDEPATTDIELAHVVESLAFATEDPIPLKKVARIFADTLGIKLPSEKKVRAAVTQLNEAYAADGRTYRIKEWAGGIRMASHPQYAQFIRALYKDNRPKKLSRTLMETLAIIAYSQPSTKPEIDFVRGVDSDYAVRKLLELGLIDIVGRSDSIGRPLLYGTSERFLEQFGLSEIGALPKLREVEDLLGDPSFKKERLQLLALDEMDTAADSSATEAGEGSAADVPVSKTGNTTAAPKAVQGGTVDATGPSAAPKSTGPGDEPAAA